jgi:amino acid adenylation domain-containing protein
MAEVRTDQNSLAALIAAQAALRGNAIAVDDGETRLSYAELIARARALGAVLAPLEAPIGILLPIGTRYIVAIVAALLAGKTFVPMDIGFPEKRNLRIMSHSGMTAVIVDDATAGIVDASVQRVPVTSASDPAILAPAAERSDRILTIFYTSGSTGEPKGVCHSESGLLYDLGHFIESHGLRAGDVHSLLFSPSVSISNRDIYATLIVGARLAIVDLKRIGIGPALQALAAQGATIFHSVPSAFRALFGSGHPDAAAAVRTIRMVRLNGDRVLKRDVELYRSAFPPESRLSLDIATTETRPYAAWLVDHETPLPRPLVPVGYPRPDLNVALLDDDGVAVPEGEIGEIVVASEGLSAGYWRDPELTAERFFPSARLPGMTEYRSGDFGRMLPGGLIEFVGRRDRQIKVRGNTVHLGEIEAAVGDCPGIGDAAAIARAEGGETRVILYCTAREGMADAVRDWCRASLPPVHRPAGIIVLDALPMLGPGKIDLVELERVDGERVLTAAGIEPAGEDEVAQAWAERLSAASLAADTTFEEAGGDSLLAMMLVLDLERRLGRHLPNGLIDWKTRPSDLSSRIAALGTQDPIQSGDRPLLLFFPGAYGADFASSDFLRLLGEAFDTVLLDYRTPQAELIGPIDREEVFRAVDAEIAGRGAKRLWILGYSLGSRIGAEAARRSIERGVAVEFVGLIDGPSDSLIAERVAKGKAAAPVMPPLAKRVAAAGGWFGFATARVTASFAHRMVTRGDFAGLRGAMATLSRLGFNAASNEVARVTLSRTRVKAFKNILAGPLPMPATLFVSSASYSKSRVTPDLGWTEWCRGLDIIALDGDHQEIIEGAQAGRIVAALRDAEAQLRSSRAA